MKVEVGALPLPVADPEPEAEAEAPEPDPDPDSEPEPEPEPEPEVLVALPELEPAPWLPAAEELAASEDAVVEPAVVLPAEEDWVAVVRVVAVVEASLAVVVASLDSEELEEVVVVLDSLESRV